MEVKYADKTELEIGIKKFIALNVQKSSEGLLIEDTVSHSAILSATFFGNGYNATRTYMCLTGAGEINFLFTQLMSLTRYFKSLGHWYH